MIDYAKPKQINFFIIAQAQRCVWALLIYWNSSGIHMCKQYKMCSHRKNSRDNPGYSFL